MKRYETPLAVQWDNALESVKRGKAVYRSVSARCAPLKIFRYNTVRLTGLGKGPGPFFSAGKEATNIWTSTQLRIW